MPASRNARAITFAPRSWPSKPGLATSTRMRGSIRLDVSTCDGSTGPAALYDAGFGVDAEDFAERVADLAHGGVGTDRIQDKRHGVLRAPGGVTQSVQTILDSGVVPSGLQ